MSQLSDARAALGAAQRAEQEAQATHRALGIDLNAMQEQADEARRAGNVAVLAETTTRIAALREVMADAAAVVRAKSAARSAAEQDVRDIEQSAANLEAQIATLEAELTAPRSHWQQAVWRAESDLRQAQHGLERAQRELQEANAHLGELRRRLAALEGDA